ncbi:hypothetical protein KBY96_14420 [Cyanobium sp. ATX 6A2]|uniref:hypothetical protein n=1 Tax=Cyanobium sp. ATX 6A2 TaxID=2823700 RepID=UPI0020CF3D35|nr:hypothetical protein [Cyanobium sp. ATX 6A2]MCP9889117.1 hypothetical protein [Cyanobium sp. ATX 6A2]
MDIHTNPDSFLASQRDPSGSCLGRTCMKWTADGELSDIDIQLILQRLREVDAEMQVA